MNENITVILLSHKSKDLVINFIEKIYEKFSIIIIDNSNDKELENIIKKKNKKITFKIIENNGYGAAINYASSLVKTKYFLICNPDIEDLDENKINEFEKAAKLLDDKFSVLGPRYTNLDPKSIKQSDEGKEISKMKFISGACMFFKKKLFDELGGFDENFFLYFEESDFCLKASKVSQSYQINNIQIKHNIGSSVKVKNEKEKENLNKLYKWHFIWSKYYYYKKNYGLLLSILYFVPIYIRIRLRILFYTINKNNKKRENYLIRLDGLMTSVKGNKSHKRIDD